MMSNASPLRCLPQSAAWHTTLATSPEQLSAAEALVRRRYAGRGYRVPVPHAERGDGRATLLARYAGRLMGTLTLRPDTSCGLFAESTYAAEILQMRREGRRLGELVRLALEEGVDLKAALDALVQPAYVVGRLLHGLTDVVIEVNPRHVGFHRRVFGFAVVAAEGFCERVGAPSVLLQLDLKRFARGLQLAA
jgi:hypothetical protein